jgi:capsular polysaccharide biosynthesis protein
MGTLQEESSVFDVFQPLIQKWKWIVAGVLTGLLVAAGVTAISKKQYQTSVILQIGAVQDKQIEDSNTVVEILNSDSFHQTVAKRLKLNLTSRQLAKNIHAETNLTRYSPLVSVTVLSDSPEGAVRLAETVFEVIDERHQPMFDQKMSYYNQFQKMLEDKVKAFDDDLNQLKEEQASLASKGDLSTKILLQARIGDRETEALSVKRELRDLLAFSSSVHSHSTNMVSPPVQPQRPVKPNLRLNLVIAFLVSLFAMVSFILISDQYRKATLRIE